MAGIGFELKKLFVGRGAIRKLRAYAYASVICAGTMMLAFVLLISVQTLTKAYGATQRETDSLVVLMVYALGASLLLSSLFQTLLSRFVADQIYMERSDRVIPSLLGGSIALIIPGGAAYGLLLLKTPELSALDRVLNLALFLELIIVWLEMAYITAAKNYKRVLYGFLAGVLTAILLVWLLLALGVGIVTTVMLALFFGYGVMMVLFLRVLLDYFPTGKGSLFYFIGWIGKYPDLIPTGLFCMLGAYVHLIVMWFSPLGEAVIGPFRHAPLHDSAAFYAFLVSLPSSINFVISVEVNFYEKYQRYFAAITGGGTLSEIGLAREDMIAVLKREVLNLAQVQIFVTVIYAVFMRYYLESIGFTRDMISMFQVICVGYGTYAIGNCLVLLLLYFNDRMGALATSAAFFLANLMVSLWTVNRSMLYYDISLVVAGVAMYLLGVLRLFTYVREIDYYVFCGQPVLASRHKSWWERWADALDRRALRPPGRESVKAARKESIPL